MQGGAIIALLSLSRSRFTSSLAPAIGDYSHGHDKRAMDRKDGGRSPCNLHRSNSSAIRSNLRRTVPKAPGRCVSFRDDSDAVGADGKPRDVIGVLEMLTWT